MLSKWNEIVSKTGQNGKELLIEALGNVGRVDLAEEISEDRTSVSSYDGSVLAHNDIVIIVKKVDGACMRRHQSEVHETSGNDSMSKLLRQISFKRSSRKIDDYIDQSIQYLEHKEKDKDLLVPTRAYRHTEELYRSKRVVMLLGNPGDGKTTIAIQLLLKLHKDGETVVVLSNPSLIEHIYDSNTRTVFFIDDAFGTPTFDKSLVDNWIRLYEKLESLTKSNKCALVLTSRKQVFTQCVNLLNKCEFIKENIVDISAGADQFSPQERTLIAGKYLKRMGASSKIESVKIPVSSYIPGFPLMCKMYSTICYKGKDAVEYFENPIIFFKQQVESLHASDPISYGGLVLITIFDGRLPRDVLDDFEQPDAETQSKLEAVMKCCGLNPNNDKARVEENLESMVGVYVDVVDDEFFFLHDSIFDAVCFVFGKRRPKEILKVASANFVERRVRTQNTKDITDESNLIILPKGRYKDLAERWLKDMKDGNLSSVYDNPSFDDEYMRAVFMTRMRSISNEEIWSMMNLCDKKRGKPCISLACSAGMESVVVLSIEKLIESNYTPSFDTSKDNLYKGFFELVRKRFLNATEALLRLNIIDVNHCLKPDRKQAVHLAVQNGDAEMLDLLLRHNATFAKRDYEGALPIHYACQSKTSVLHAHVTQLWCKGKCS
ncbi:hypothetical protein FSP39_008458 [Pinctada imbricata]|uniref:Novel STAND NTPase 3 domain-containing protein n=1 Tax=Pinctada imbricata TaxID=66713 RepID=A0AA89C5M4_PINIB|nr:hypothetical protein FSP39_008458 [Pinctada imbricata]